MGNQHEIEPPSKKVPKASLIGALFSKKEKDEDYLPELKAQWESMDGKQRVRFLLGAAVGFVLFMSVITLFYLFIAKLAR